MLRSVIAIVIYSCNINTAQASWNIHSLARKFQRNEREKLRHFNKSVWFQCLLTHSHSYHYSFFYVVVVVVVVDFFYSSMLIIAHKYLMPFFYASSTIFSLLLSLAFWLHVLPFYFLGVVFLMLLYKCCDFLLNISFVCLRLYLKRIFFFSFSSFFIK